MTVKLIPSSFQRFNTSDGPDYYEIVKDIQNVIAESISSLIPLLHRRWVLRKNVSDYYVNEQVSTAPSVITVLTDRSSNKR